MVGPVVVDAGPLIHLAQADGLSLLDEFETVSVPETVLREVNSGPERVAERYNLDIADVYEALAYYHSNPEEMARVEERHRTAAKHAEQRSTITPPENWRPTGSC